MSLSSKDRKSIIYHYDRGHSVAEMAAWSRFRFVDPSEMQEVIDREYAEPKPTRADDPRTRLADVLFEGHEEWERDSLMDDLLELVRS